MDKNILLVHLQIMSARASWLAREHSEASKQHEKAIDKRHAIHWQKEAHAIHAAIALLR